MLYRLFREQITVVDHAEGTSDSRKNIPGLFLGCD